VAVILLIVKAGKLGTKQITEADLLKILA